MSRALRHMGCARCGTDVIATMGMAEGGAIRIGMLPRLSGRGQPLLAALIMKSSSTLYPAELRYYSESFHFTSLSL
jgi:hypothetical protein